MTVRIGINIRCIGRRTCCEAENVPKKAEKVKYTTWYISC